MGCSAEELHYNGNEVLQSHGYHQNRKKNKVKKLEGPEKIASVNELRSFENKK